MTTNEELWQMSIDKDILDYNKSLKYDKPKLKIYQLKYELENKISIVEETLERIYSGSWFERYKLDKKLCPKCNSILVEPIRHPLETLKLKYIEELNLINIAIDDLNTQ